MMNKNSLKRPRLDWRWPSKKHVKSDVAVEVDEECKKIYIQPGTRCSRYILDNHFIRRWEELDNEILVSIMKRLSSRNLIFSICFVCKSWLNAALDTLFPPQDVFNMCDYSFLCTSYMPSCLRFWKMIELHLNRDQPKHYTKLVLTDILSNEGYCYIAKRLPSIRSVTFRHIGQQKLYRFRDFASCWKELVEVECSASCLKLVGVFWNQIHTLRLDGYVVKVEDAIDVATNFPCLTHLSLRYCTLMDNALSLILESHTNLTYLDISHACLREKNVVKDWDEDFLLKASTTITQFVRCEMRNCRFCYHKYPPL